MFLAKITWGYRFRPFTTFHLVAVLVSSALVFTVVRLGLRARGTPREAAIRKWWGWSIVAGQALALVWWLGPSGYGYDQSLPLHLCRVAAWISALGMLTEWRWARTLTYFWGLGLCLQGFLTPLRLGGLCDPEFWIFRVGHLHIVGSGAYAVIVLRYRPTPHDLGIASLASLAYVAAIVPFNLLAGTDYGYLGRGNYRTRNVIDWLGPWPRRAVLLYLIGQGMLTLLYLVWLVPAAWRAVSARGESPVADAEPGS
jgi:hypothetical integral membrane protein (TIGR02206 family)